MSEIGIASEEWTLVLNARSGNLEIYSSGIYAVRHAMVSELCCSHIIFASKSDEWESGKMLPHLVEVRLFADPLKNFLENHT